MRRRDPGYTSQAELEAAMAPFSRPPALTAWDLPDTFIVQALSFDGMGHDRMTFTPRARAKLQSHLSPNSDRADAAIAWLEDELRWVFFEELGYAGRYTHPQFVAALRALARLNPSAPPPVLSRAFLDAVKSNERLPETERYLPEDLEPLPYDDKLETLVTWSDLSTAELSRRADAMLQAVRRRRPDNWELLARQAQWEPLRQGTIELCARMWVEVLARSASASKALLAFTLELLALVDPTFPRSPDEDLVESIRARLAKALKIRRH